MKNQLIRSLTGIVYIAIITLSVICSRYTFFALFTLTTFLCLWEFYRLINIHKGMNINPYIYAGGGAALFLSFFLHTSGIVGHSIFSLYFLFILGAFIYELYAKEKQPIVRLSFIFFGQCYLALPFSLLNLLAFPNMTANIPIYHWNWIIVLFIFLWANDTGAYLIGVQFGKHRLLERISPKKSWEGAFGGLIFAIAAALILAHFNQQIAWYHWIVLSAAVAVAGVYGDLFESLIKRTLEVKDSGDSLPGHGGFLDRFDSFLLAVYVLLFYIQFFIQS